MNLATSFVAILLALGLLLPSLAGANEPVNRSVDDKGTIHIGTDSKAGKEKAGDQAGEAKAQSGSAAQKQATPPEPPPPGLIPSHSRRLRGPAAAARRQAFEKAHPDLVPARPVTPAPQTPAPKAGPQPAPPPPEPR
jgi:hypothetical protein